ncbi:MAG: translation initiation factor IF-2 [Candidatus Shapirobacteria bacterium]|jgi:translation initiation factor IF-2
MDKNHSPFRPPIVVVMGHIDHGKTSLLDKIRSTKVFEKEVGGITQHIGAYQVSIGQKGNQPNQITFIDTPGHAAFINMRARGAQITDLVVLVIAATEGVKIQTKECLSLIQKANLPFIVAMNKMDLPGANPDMLKGQLVELGFTPEEYGGDIMCIPVSAKSGQGIDKLLEMILLQAELMELKNEPDSQLEAVIIESRLDKSRGPVASTIVRKGTLTVGDVIYAQETPCKVKAMINYLGENIKTAYPSTPIEILGFEKTPQVGSIITANPVTSTKINFRKPDVQTSSDLTSQKVLRLPIIVKADVEGSLEALLDSFSDDVEVLFSGVGAISDNDIFLAQASGAQVFAFNVSTPKFIKNLAENQKVKIHESKIIYEIIEEIQSQVLKLLEPTIDETITGEGLIRAEFKIEKVRIAGMQCTKGEIKKGDLIHLKRDGEIIKDTKVEGLHQGKLVVEKVKAGSDCGITFKPYVDFKLNDVIISYNK